MKANAKRSIAKITRPAVSDVLHRKRLFHFLDNARKRPVVWIMGPPGSGKTTLITSYLQVSRMPCLWYQVDEGDADIASFFTILDLQPTELRPDANPCQILPLNTYQGCQHLQGTTLGSYITDLIPLYPPLKKGGAISSIPSFSKGGSGRIKKVDSPLSLTIIRTPRQSHCFTRQWQLHSQGFQRAYPL